MTGLLPRGEHPATWAEVEATFGGNQRRRELLAGLLEACKVLHAAGVKHFVLDGGFVTAKARPRDWDGCYPEAELDPSRLADPVFRLMNGQTDRDAMNARYHGEAFVAEWIADRHTREPYRTYFTNVTDYPRRKKGLVVIDLDTLP